jgi:hypothetical protein
MRFVLPQLAIAGRRRFGEFVANALLGASGAIGLAVILPTWAGVAKISAAAVAAGALMLALCAAGGVAVRYMTEERLGEGEGFPL